MLLCIIAVVIFDMSSFSTRITKRDELIFSKHFKIATAWILSSGMWFVFAVMQTIIWTNFKKLL